MNFPNLFCVGFPKAGTSSLCSFLRQQENIFLPSKNQPNFLCFPDKYPIFSGPKDQLNYGSMGYSSMSEYIEAYQDSHANQYRADISPFYLYRPHITASMIKAYSKNPKIIICIRHPVDASYSMYKMLRRDKREKSLSYSAAFKISDYRVNKLNWEYAWDYSSRYLYYEAIKIYLDMFGTEKILFLHYDDLTKNKAKYISQISSFLGINLATKHYPHENKSREFEIPVKTNNTRNQLVNRVKTIIKSSKSIVDTKDNNFKREIYNSYFRKDYEQSLRIAGLTQHNPIQ